MKMLVKIAVCLFFTFINVQCFRKHNNYTEDSLDELIGHKVYETCDQLMKERHLKYELQEVTLKEHQRKLEMQADVLKEHERVLGLQDKMLKEYQMKLEQHDHVERELINQVELWKKMSTEEVKTGEKSNRKSEKTQRSTLAEGIAFSTQLSVVQRHIGLRQTIKYDKVHLNDGDAYSVHSGVFTAPQSGVYMFAYFLGHGSEPAQAWLELMVNGHKINAAVSDTFHTSEDLQGGNFAIIHLDAGDAVWIESWHANDAYIDGPYGFTSFSGALLY